MHQPFVKLKMRANYIFEKWLNAVASKFETSTVFTRLEAGGGGGGGGGAASIY